MRRLFRSVVALAALAMGLPGCGKPAEDGRPAPSSSPDRTTDGEAASLSKVTFLVPGMT